MRGPVFRVILFFVSFALLFTFLNPSLIINVFSTLGGGWAVKVNGYKVLPSEFQMALRQKQEEQKQFERYRQKLNLVGFADIDPQEAAIKQVVNDQIVEQVARSLKIVVPEEMLRRSMMKSLPQQLLNSDGTINYALLQQVFPDKSPADIERLFERDIKGTSVLQAAHAASYVPQFMIKNQIVDQYSPKNIGVISFSLPFYVAAAKKDIVSEQDVKSFFERENKTTKKYWLPEKRTVTVWSFPAESYGSVVSDKEIERYYNSHKNEYVEVPAQRQIRYLLFASDEKSAGVPRADMSAVLAEARKEPAKFADLVKKHSVDKKISSQGGLMTIKKEGKNQKLEEVAFGLVKDGDISEVVQTPEGFVIIQRISHTPAVYKPLAKVSNQIKAMLNKERLEKNFLQSSRRVIQQYRDGEEDAFNDFVKRHAGVETRKTFASTDKSLEAEHVFAAKKANEMFAFYGANVGYIVKINSIDYRKQPSFETVKQKVYEDFYASKGALEMAKAVREAKKASESKPLAQVAQAMGLTFKTTGLIALSDRSKMDALEKEHFPVASFGDLQQVGLVKELLTPTDGYLMTLLDVKSVDPSLIETKKAELGRTLQGMQDRLLIQGFIASLTKTAKIKINETQLSTKAKR
jgi:parvulin-like peptidyl-prolyl isomerase